MDRINRIINHNNDSIDYDDAEAYQQLEEAYELTKFAAEEADIDLKDVEALGHIYGIERREEQLQKMCDSFQRLKMTHRINARPHKKEEAIDNYTEAARNYLGSEMTLEEVAADTTQLASGMSMNGSTNLEEAKEIMNMSKDEFEEMIRNL